MTKRRRITHRSIGEEYRALLEEQFIDDFIEHKGYRWEDIYRLPEEATERVMIEASRYAADKLAEHEAHTRFRHEVQRD